MSRRTIKELSSGEAVDEVYLVTDKQLRTNRQGNLYLQLELRDRTGVLDARLWNTTEEFAGTIESGQYVRARGRTQVHQGALQLVLSGIAPAGEAAIDPAEFFPKPACDVPKLLEKLRQFLMSVGNPHLKALAECFLIDGGFMDQFARAPAGIRHHHAYPGGLLEHVVTMMTVADRIVGLYPEVDRDLLLIGVFLHDIGKIDELTSEHALGYSDEGQLVGHLVQGVGIFRRKLGPVRELMDEPFPEEYRLRIEHMIVSHHGSLEYGSPKVPMTAEAMALWCIDHLDAQMNHLSSQLRDEANRGGRWTAYDATLGRKFFRGLGMGQGGGEEPNGG
jgi:3'-5' exoribonuclease